MKKIIVRVPWASVYYGPILFCLFVTMKYVNPLFNNTKKTSCTLPLCSVFGMQLAYLPLLFFCLGVVCSLFNSGNSFVFPHRITIISIITLHISTILGKFATVDHEWTILSYDNQYNLYISKGLKTISCNKGFKL